MNRKYIIISLLLIALFVCVSECEAQTIESILQDKYEMNQKLYPHMDYTYEMFVYDDDFVPELVALWKLKTPFHKQSDQFKAWYEKEMNVVPKIKEDNTLMFVAIGLVLTDIVITTIFGRSIYLKLRYPDR